MTPTLMEKNKTLENCGIKTSGKIYWNLSIPVLYEEAIKRNEGLASKYGPVVVNTAPFTGRSPKDRFIVKESSCSDKVSWGKINQPFDEGKFDALKRLVLEHMQKKDLFVKDCYVGADEKSKLTLRVISERAIGALFAGTMFIQENDLKKLESFIPEFTVLHAPSLNADPKIHGTNSGTFVILNFKGKLILIGGTSYAGEIKKSMFSVMNYFLPHKGIMTMHASANYGKD